jgi:hypothetical protein
LLLFTRFLLLLLFLLVLLIEHEVECGKCSTINAVAVEDSPHRGIASERTKNNRRATR